MHLHLCYTITAKSNKHYILFSAQSLDVTKMLAKEVDFKDMFGIYEVMVTIANRSLTHENVQKFMMDPNEKFDLVIAEWLYHHLYAG